MFYSLQMLPNDLVEGLWLLESLKASTASYYSSMSRPGKPLHRQGSIIGHAYQLVPLSLRGLSSER